MARAKLAGVLLALWCALAAAQTPVIGFLNGASYELSAHLVRAFHQGLGEAGFAEGRNVVFEYRSAEGKYERLPALAAELAKRRVNLIAATGAPAGLPAKNATSTTRWVSRCPRRCSPAPTS